MYMEIVIAEIDGVDLFVIVEKFEAVEMEDMVATVSMIIVIVMFVVVEEMILYVDVEKEKNKPLKLERLCPFLNVQNR